MSDACPKCDTAWGDRPACARCGLARANADAFRAADAVAPTASLEAAWAACRAAWSDPAAHTRVATAALVTSDFAWLAGRYRAVLREAPDDAVARERLAALGRQAQAALVATAGSSAPARARSRGTLAILVIVLIAIVTGTTFAVLRAQKRARDAEQRYRRETPGLPRTPIEPPPARR